MILWFVLVVTLFAGISFLLDDSSMEAGTRTNGYILLAAIVTIGAIWQAAGMTIARGALFLLALVFAASMMPVKSLPAPSWETTFGLGFLSAVFDNIPLTALAMKQDNYHWALLAYAVGFGGSMIWFGWSAGVAVAALMHEARSSVRWLREGWFVPVAYVVGFFLMLALLGWNPENLFKSNILA